MKFDLSSPLKGLDGQEFPLSEKSSVTFGDVLKAALRAPLLYQEGQAIGQPRPMMPSDIDEREQLTSGIEDGYLNIKPEQVATLKKLVGASGYMPEVCVSFSSVLNRGGTDR